MPKTSNDLARRLCALGAQHVVDAAIVRLRAKGPELAAALGGQALRVAIELPELSRRLLVTPAGTLVSPTKVDDGVDIELVGPGARLALALLGDGASPERAASHGVLRVVGDPSLLPPLHALFDVVRATLEEVARTAISA